MARYIIRRTKNDTKVVFGRAARRVGRQPLGECLAIGNGNGTINIKNLVETDSRGSDFFELKNITHTDFWTRSFDSDRKISGSDEQVGGHTSEASVVTALNEILGTGLVRALSPLESGTIGNLCIGIEKGTDGTASNILDESSNTFILESGSDTIILTHADGTITDIDARSVGGTGNPVTSGAVSGTNLVLTLNDSSTVTIDATKMVNGTEATIGLPNWYQTYASPGTGSSTAGSQVSGTQPPGTSNPYYFGITLKRGREFTFDHSTNSVANYFGIWGGSTSYTPANAGARALWTKMLSRANAQLNHGTGDYHSKGFDHTADYSLTQGSSKLVLQYDYDTNKLKLWEVTGDYWNLITTASVAEDGNPVIISCALPTNGVLPTFTDREQTWNIIAQANAGADTTWRDGGLQDTVIKHNVGLHPGEKMVTTTPASWSGHYLGFNYSGTSTGQVNVENESTAVLQCASTERFYEKSGFTVNTKATRWDDSSGSNDFTDIMGGGKVSFRYHLDNSFDLYDEDNEEVLFTKDSNFDGSTVFLHMFFSATISQFNNYTIHNWTFEPFAAAWYYHPESIYKPRQRYTSADLPGSSRLIWGEKMYPGQELIFQENQGGSGNTYVGLRDAGDTTWTKSFSLDGTKVRAGVGEVVGFDIATNYASGYTCNAKWLALRYTKGDNKLRLYDIHTTGVETLITTANVAEDGNAIRISISGNNKTLDGTTMLRYYGWEYKHTPTNFPQPWGNWRLDRPTPNTALKTDTVVRHRQGLVPGNYMRWTTPNSGQQVFNGGWKSSNSVSGLTNVETTVSFWDWGFRMNNAERINNLHNMTFNTSNTDYVDASTGWSDPNKGVTQIQLRYHSSTNKIDLHDHTNNRVIATKDTDGDGNAIYLAHGIGTDTTDLSDNFFGGGDVEVGSSNFAPSFTNVLNYGNDGILHQAEMVKLDSTVPVGKRLIVYPDFWGLLEDMGGAASSGPAPNGTGWVEDDTVIMGWQKANSPFVGTNIGNTNSGWDAAAYMLLRGPGTQYASRIAIYSPGNAAFTFRDGRSGTGNYTDLYYTFDRIATNSGRIMMFPSLAAARAGKTGDNTQWYGNSSDTYANGNAQTLALTGDLNIYIFSNAGSFTLPTVACTEIVTIPT